MFCMYVLYSTLGVQTRTTLHETFNELKVTLIELVSMSPRITLRPLYSKPLPLHKLTEKKKYPIRHT